VGMQNFWENDRRRPKRGGELLKDEPLSVDQGQTISRRLKKRRSIRAVKVVPGAGMHGVIDWDRPIRQEWPATLRAAAGGREARACECRSFPRLSRRPASGEGMENDAGQLEQEGGDEREMAGTPRGRQVPSCPSHRCPFFATASARTEEKQADSRSRGGSVRLKLGVSAK
jgi:hypothetical protein